MSPQEAEKEKDDLPFRPKALVEWGEAVGRTLLVQCSVKRKGRKIPPPNKKKCREYFRPKKIAGLQYNGPLSQCVQEVRSPDSPPHSRLP